MEDNEPGPSSVKRPRNPRPLSEVRPTQINRRPADGSSANKRDGQVSAEKTSHGKEPREQREASSQAAKGKRDIRHSLTPQQKAANQGQVTTRMDAASRLWSPQTPARHGLYGALQHPKEDLQPDHQDSKFVSPNVPPIARTSPRPPAVSQYHGLPPRTQPATTPSSSSSARWAPVPPTPGHRFTPDTSSAVPSTPRETSLQLASPQKTHQRTKLSAYHRNSLPTGSTEYRSEAFSAYSSSPLHQRKLAGTTGRSQASALANTRLSSQLDSRLDFFALEQQHTFIDEEEIQPEDAEQRLRAQEDIRKLLRMPEIEIPPEERVTTPIQMSCKLMEHQKVALQWLKDQEKDRYKRGGLLADTMGLGKTIEALALILAHRAPESDPKTTLIIAPLALLKQWDREIASKVKPAHKLSTFIYHGREKTTRRATRLFEYDIVITTYETVSSEYAKFAYEHKRDSRLFGDTRMFHRIILDEAHKIKNRRAQCSIAVAQLNAKYRLCMTGTPFMNNTAEIYSLIRFLHIKPYDYWPRFSEDIASPLRGWNEDEHAAAMRKLQALFRSITLRRTKDSYLDGQPIIKLPELSTAPTAAVFNEDQQAFYDALEHKQQIRLNKYIKDGNLSKVYTFILVLLLRLRQACCHPFLIKNHGIPDEAQLDGKQMMQLAMRLQQGVVDRTLSKSAFQCPLCDESAETPIIIYPCGHDICSGCFSSMMQVALEARKNGGQSHLFVSGEADMDTVCPHEGCDSEIDPKKIICHNYFLDAHSPEGGSQNSERDSSDDEETDCCSLDGDSDTESVDDDDLKDFIVSDPEEGTEMDSKEDEGDENMDEGSGLNVRSCITRSPTPDPFWKNSNEMEAEKDDKSEREGAKEEKMSDDTETQEGHEEAMEAGAVKGENASDGKGKEVNLRSNCKGASNPFIDSDTELDQTSAERGSPFAQEDPVAETDQSTTVAKDDIWAGVLARYRKAKEAKTTEDSDSDDSSLLSLGDLNSKPKSKPKPKPSVTQAGSSTQRATKRKRPAGEKAVQAPAKRFKKGKEVEAAREPTRPHRKHNTKGKDKGKIMTLGQLRKDASSNKAAKAKYFARLRKDYESSAKVEVTLSLLRSIRKGKPAEKTLVFSLWTSFLDILEIPLQDEGFRYLRYDGGMTFTERDDNVKAFSEDPSVKILLVSLMAGNAGLNLTAASQVIVLEPFWNPFVEDQAVDRAHRIGQKRAVDVHKVLVAGTVEDRILSLQEKKRRLVNAALSEEGAQGAARLSIGELRGLFGIS